MASVAPLFFQRNRIETVYKAIRQRLNNQQAFSSPNGELGKTRLRGWLRRHRPFEPDPGNAGGGRDEASFSAISCLS
jgi:hypothetical protein